MAWYGRWEIARFTRAEIVEQLERLDRTVSAALRGVEAVQPEALDRVADELGRPTGLRIELLAPDGQRLAHSRGGEAERSPLADRPVVQRVLAGGEGGVLELPGEGGQIGELALVRPWRQEGSSLGALITALPRDVLDGPLQAVLLGGLVALVLSLLLFSLVALRLSRRLSRSVQRLL
jgi:hypothetical protein